jgi:hypothetical protein
MSVFLFPLTPPSITENGGISPLGARTRHGRRNARCGSRPQLPETIKLNVAPWRPSPPKASLPSAGRRTDAVRCLRYREVPSDNLLRFREAQGSPKGKVIGCLFFSILFFGQAKKRITQPSVTKQTKQHTFICCGT